MCNTVLVVRTYEEVTIVVARISPLDVRTRQQVRGTGGGTASSVSQSE